MNSLAYNKFGDNGLRALALKFKLIPHLQILKLGNNHIMKHLIEANQFSEIGMKDLTEQLKFIAHIKCLTLSNTDLFRKY